MDGTDEETGQDVLDDGKAREIRRDIHASGYAAPGGRPGPKYRLADLRLRDLKVHDSTTTGSRTEAIQIRGYDEATVLRYAYAFRELPPIEVLRVDGESLVVDGFHRRRAAERLGLKTLRAWVKDGTYDEALDRAVMANLRHGRPFRGDDLHAVILRLRRLHPEMTGRKVATIVGCSHTTADAVPAVNAQRREAGMPGGNLLPFTVGREILKAPGDAQIGLANRACDEGWNVEQARQEVAALNDPPAPEDERGVPAAVVGSSDPWPGLDDEVAALMAARGDPDEGTGVAPGSPLAGHGPGNRRYDPCHPHEHLEQALARLREVHKGGQAAGTFLPDDKARARLVVVACTAEVRFLNAVVEAARAQMGDDVVADEGMFLLAPTDGSATEDMHDTPPAPRILHPTPADEGAKDTPSSPRTLRRRTKAADHVA